MTHTILVTGSLGLIGQILVKKLKTKGFNVLELDQRFPQDHLSHGDIRDKKLLQRLLAQATGIVHLAAVSRVVWGEQNPSLCWEVNVEATHALLELIKQSQHKPWIIYASSREVYGQQNNLPVLDNNELAPMNHYARSKLAAEKWMNVYRQDGLLTSILRFSSVYGSIADHPDRVIPAFCRAAINNKTLRIDGFNNVFDFTHVADTVEGILAVINKLQASVNDLPAMHLTTGIGTSLFELASFIQTILNKPLQFSEAPARNYDVHRFYAEPTYAKNILNWNPSIKLQDGLKNLLIQYQQELISNQINL